MKDNKTKQTHFALLMTSPLTMDRLFYARVKKYGDEHPGFLEAADIVEYLKDTYPDCARRKLGAMVSIVVKILQQPEFSKLRSNSPIDS